MYVLLQYRLSDCLYARLSAVRNYYNLKMYNLILQAKLYERCVCAVGTPRGHRRDAERTLCASCNWQIDILGIYRGSPTTNLKYFLSAVQTLWHRRLV